MILLLGGTCETAPLAAALAGAGWRVLVSMATDVPLALTDDPGIEHRQGRLDPAAMTALARERGIRAIVDAAHPYAAEAHQTARAAAKTLGIPCLRWQRQATDFLGEDVEVAESHEAAARLAAAWGRPILLTTGSRNLAPYVRAAGERGLPLLARVLPHAESLEACRRAGLPESRVIAARGPFSLEDNCKLIREFEIGVLVTKDSGPEGGLPEKLAAARQTGCRVVAIRRPAPGEPGFTAIGELLQALRVQMGAPAADDPAFSSTIKNGDIWPR